MPSLKETYTSAVTPALQEKFGYKNRMMVPRVEKVVVNTGFGKLILPKTGDDRQKTLEAVLGDISQIAGQRAAQAEAKKSIAGFKLREGNVIGAKVTLRGSRMYDFLTRLIQIVLPRSRDFRGIPRESVDKQGNCTLGIREHIFFPEISPENVRNIFGLEITIVTTAKTHEEGLALLEAIGIPFKKEEG